MQCDLITQKCAIASESSEKQCRFSIRAAQNTASPETPKQWHFLSKNRSSRATLPELAVLKPGVYFVELYCNDTFIDDRALRITSREESQP